jgi:hypothetical protein
MASSQVGIVTLHYGFNEGAILQSYSVARALSEALPECGAEIIDHRYPGKLAAEGTPTTDRKKMLRHAVDTWLPLSKRRFVEKTHDEAFNYIRENCQAVVAGSDVLWRFVFKRFCGGIFASQPGGFFTPVPNVYWPDATLRMPRIAYAASIGPSDWTTMPTWCRKKLGGILSEFCLLGVRDSRTLAFLSWLKPGLAERALCVPDPTWAVDLLPLVDTERLKARLQSAGVDFTRPRCGFIAGPGGVGKECAEALRKKGYQIVGISTENDYSDVPLFQQGFHPLEWARLPAFCDVCISERMHGTIFCLQNRTPVISLDINETKDDWDSKTLCLLRSLDLAHSCFPKRTASAGDILAACSDAENGSWDWGAVELKIDALRESSRAFLAQVRQAVLPGVSV